MYWRTVTLPRDAAAPHFSAISREMPLSQQPVMMISARWAWHASVSRSPRGTSRVVPSVLAWCSLIALRAHALHAQGFLQGDPVTVRPGVPQSFAELFQEAQLHLVAGLPRQDAEHAVAAAEAHQLCRLRGGQVILLQTALEAIAEAFKVFHPLHLPPNYPYYKRKRFFCQILIH